MNGWTGVVFRSQSGIDFTLFWPCWLFPRSLKCSDFAAGIEDTLDGSSGYTFTFLPIVFEDHCQVCDLHFEYKSSEVPHYRIVVTFLTPETAG